MSSSTRKSRNRSLLIRDARIIDPMILKTIRHIVKYVDEYQGECFKVPFIYKLDDHIETKYKTLGKLVNYDISSHKMNPSRKSVARKYKLVFEYKKKERAYDFFTSQKLLHVDCSLIYSPSIYAGRNTRKRRVKKYTNFF